MAPAAEVARDKGNASHKRRVHKIMGSGSPKAVTNAQVVTGTNRDAMSAGHGSNVRSNHVPSVRRTPNSRAPNNRPDAKKASAMPPDRNMGNATSALGRKANAAVARTSARHAKASRTVHRAIANRSTMVNTHLPVTTAVHSGRTSHVSNVRTTAGIAHNKSAGTTRPNRTTPP